jgi:hypothetical protein
MANIRNTSVEGDAIGRHEVESGSPHGCVHGVLFPWRHDHRTSAFSRTLTRRGGRSLVVAKDTRTQDGLLMLLCLQGKGV